MKFNVENILMDDIQPGSSPCWLTLRDQYLLVIMKYIDSKGGFDLSNGRLTIDFKDNNEIRNINISKNYEPPTLP